LTNQKQELPMVAMFVDGSGQNEQSLKRTFHRCFLPSFTSFGWEVSEKIKMWKVNGRQTTTPSDDKSSHCLWQGGHKNNCAVIIKVKVQTNIKVCWIRISKFKPECLSCSPTIKTDCLFTAETMLKVA
jgi:hypothetical protein